MNDKRIRLALWQKILRRYLSLPNALVLEEIGIRHGTARVDFLLVNGLLHGFELKSDRDTLRRLERQAGIYNSVLDRMTLVVGFRHADSALRMIPQWWGVKLVSSGKRGGIHFHDARTPQDNPQLDKAAVVKLLWREDALQILTQLGLEAGMHSKSRRVIYERLVECADLDFIRAKTRYYLRLRNAPGFDEQRTLNGD